MASMSVIILSNAPAAFNSFKDFVQHTGTFIIIAPDLDEIPDADFENFFNPVVIIDIDEVNRKALSQSVERCVQKRIPFFFAAELLNDEVFAELSLHKPQGYLCKGNQAVCSFYNMRQALHNQSSQQLKSQKLDALFVKNGKDYERISSHEILWIQASGNYIEIFTNEKSYVLRIGLKEIEERLPDEQFIRIHKSYIVNKHHIIKFNSSSIKTGQGELPLARSYFNAVLAAFMVI